MNKSELLDYVANLLEKMPQDWLKKTTHRLDVYNESKAKTEFLEGIEKLYKESEKASLDSLKKLPTAYDYIRLGHPLSCLLEWSVAKLNDLKAESVISFSSQTMPLLAILRKNLFEKKNTQILYQGDMLFDIAALKSVYGYNFEIKRIDDLGQIEKFSGSQVLITGAALLEEVNLNEDIDFLIKTFPKVGSIVLVNTREDKETYIKEIQHVRRRESIAMTPQNCLRLLNHMIKGSENLEESGELKENKNLVLEEIRRITQVNTKPLLGSCGLSIQYAILMGLIQSARENHKGKKIKIIVPPNCYGGTNDQARRVAACVSDVEVVDLLVDSGNDMVSSVDVILEDLAKTDALPLIIAEIPTNPRVEVPDMNKLSEALTKNRETLDGEEAIKPIFILDQTFCPNVNFLGEKGLLSDVMTISYVSGSKFPSGGLCTAGYCVANKKAESLIENIEVHLRLCDNEATAFQVETLLRNISSMNERIKNAYVNTREFVEFIKETLPQAKINFVSKKLAEQGFTPSVFSLDLPTKGDNEAERESYKRDLNYKLINLMIENIPNESQHCVSYGQLSGCYWTIPATSTQGTTKEGDKDYIVRVSMSPDMDLKTHKNIFKDFVDQI